MDILVFGSKHHKTKELGIQLPWRILLWPLASLNVKEVFSQDVFFNSLFPVIRSPGLLSKNGI